MICRPPGGSFSRKSMAGSRRPSVLHCHGGFVAAVHYGLPRPTADLDYLAIVPRSAQGLIERLGGQASLLAKKYGVYLQHVPLTSAPESYEERLTRLFPGQFISHGVPRPKVLHTSGSPRQ